MKPLIGLSLILLQSTLVNCQQLTLSQWNEEARTNIRLLPNYGYAVKTKPQLEADSEFVSVTLPRFSTKRLASEHLVDLGFKYIYQDIKTAMYRFNQAYLLDSTNSDIYWGYGAVYMTLEDYPLAKKQYQEGLVVDAKNTRIMTDYGTYFMSQGLVDSAIQYLSASYQLDSQNQNTSFKLAAAYFYKDDCKNALYYYQKCKSLGGKPISNDFVEAFKQKCNL
jgi:hypothetical protein